MSSRAHSFCKLENRLPGPGATASLVCQILSWSMEPTSPAYPSSLQAETWAHTGTCTQAHTRGSRPLAVRRTHTHAHISRHARTPRCICILVRTPVHTDISWDMCTQTMSTSCAHVRMQKHILKCMQCPCTHMYTQTHLPLYIHVCTQVQTHLHTTAHPHIHRHKTAHVHTDGIQNHVHTFAYRTTCKDLNARTCLLHTVYTQSHRLLTVNAQQP